SGDHLHRPEEKVLLGVRLPAARLPRRPLEPLPRHHVAVMRERRKKLGVGLRQVPPYERPQQRSELPAGQEGMPAARVQPSVEFVRDVEQLVHQRLHPLLGRTGAEELRPQSDAVERALALERHARAGERLDRRTRSAPGFSGREQDARRLDVRQLRQLPCHVRRVAAAFGIGEETAQIAGPPQAAVQPSQPARPPQAAPQQQPPPPAPPAPPKRKPPMMPQAPEKLEVPDSGDLAKLSPVRLYALAALTNASGSARLVPEDGGLLQIFFRRGTPEH